MPLRYRGGHGLTAKRMGRGAGREACLSRTGYRSAVVVLLYHIARLGRGQIQGRARVDHKGGRLLRALEPQHGRVEPDPCQGEQAIYSKCMIFVIGTSFQGKGWPFRTPGTTFARGIGSLVCTPRESKSAGFACLARPWAPARGPLARRERSRCTSWTGNRQIPGQRQTGTW